MSNGVDVELIFKVVLVVLFVTWVLGLVGCFGVIGRIISWVIPVIGIVIGCFVAAWCLN